MCFGSEIINRYRIHIGINHIRKGEIMIQVVVSEGRALVYSWTTGFVCKHEPSLIEEWKTNPEAVLERFDRQGRLDELEVLLDKGVLH